jgi:hypothetical protein
MSFKEKARMGMYIVATVVLSVVVSALYTTYNLTTKHNQIVDGFNARLAALDGQVEQLGRENAAFNARVEVYSAAAAIGASNFGSANEHLQAAAGLLTAACNGLSQCPYSQVQDTVSQIKVEVSDDPTEQVIVVARVGDQIDAVLGEN